MTKKKMKRVLIVTFIMLAITISLGVFVGYKFALEKAEKTVVENLERDGYKNTDDATATADDIINGKIAYVKGQKVVGEYTPFDSSDATATANSVLKGKTIVANGKIVVGNIIVWDNYKIIAGVEAISVNKNVYLKQDLIITGDKNLKPENIKKGVEIFGVVGTYVPVQGEIDE